MLVKIMNRQNFLKVKRKMCDKESKSIQLYNSYP